MSNNLVAGCNKTIIPTNITSIDDSAFGGLSDLSSISIPSGITSIGKFAFGSCYRLSSIILPKSLTSIGEGAFNNCESLETISIPDGVTSIGKETFSLCSHLTSVTVEAKTPIDISQDVFMNRANATLYVPAGSKAAYQAANYWKEFKEIIEKEDGIVKGKKVIK